MDGSDDVRARILSQKVVDKSMPNALTDILEYVKEIFPEEERPYLLIDRHPDSKYR